MGTYVPDKLIDKKPTKFHYVKVDRDEYGLTDEMLLLLDDKTINKYIPLRRLAPYREKKPLNDYQKKQVFKSLEKELERRKRELNAMSEREQEVLDQNKKLLNKKRKPDNKDKSTKDKEFLSMDEYKKKKRLETYGL